MVDIQAAYKEIAGFTPDHAAIHKIMRCGRILQLGDSDSGWLLLVTLEAHGAGVRAALNSASTLAAAAGSAASDAGKAAADAGRAATAITAAVRAAEPALGKILQTATGAATGMLEAAMAALARTIQKTGTETSERFQGIIERVGRNAVGAITTAGNEAGSTIRSAARETTTTVTTAMAKATTDLLDGAAEVRDAITEDWKTAVALAVSEKLAASTRADAAASRRQTIKTSAIAGTVATILLTGVGYAAHHYGWSDGYQVGRAAVINHVHDQKVRASWANTPDGQLAYVLYLAGSIRKLVLCNQPGWKIEKGGKVCFPDTVGSKRNKPLYGWAITP